MSAGAERLPASRTPKPVPGPYSRSSQWILWTSPGGSSGITTVYHFILVPLTIGLAPMIAIMQTMWVVTKKDHWYRLTKFFGKLFLINFAPRCSHRHRAGVPVRHELERVLAIRR